MQKFANYLKKKHTDRQNRALVKAVRQQNLPQVREAFAKGASVDAVCTRKSGPLHKLIAGWAPVPPTVHSRQPVLLTAAFGKSTEILEEVLRHKPDISLRSWHASGGQSGNSRKTLTEELASGLNYGSRDFSSAAAALGERIASGDQSEHLAPNLKKLQLLQKYLP